MDAVALGFILTGSGYTTWCLFSGAPTLKSFLASSVTTSGVLGYIIVKSFS